MITGTALWYASRATGVVSLVLFSVVAILGIMVNRQGRLPGLPRFAVTGLHRSLSLLTVAFLGIHITTAIADGYVHIPWLSTIVPFTSGYERFWKGRVERLRDHLRRTPVRTSAVRRHIRGFRRVFGLVRGLRGCGISEIV
jgi:hypothetical protein